MSARVGPTPLVGRAEELEALHAFATEALNSHLIVLVAGEAGIGKSRLVEQFAREQHDQGRQVLVGGCVELAGEPIPYAPLAEILRTIQHDADNVIGLDVQARSDLVHLLGIEGGAHPAGRSDLYERLLRLIEAIAASSGQALLVLEDLHWADQATLDFVTFLSRNLPPRVLLVLTHRNEDLGARPSLLAVLAVLARARQIRRIDLLPFTQLELAALVEAVRGQAAGTTEVESLFKRSEGNPFLAEELLVAEEPGGLPSSMDDILLARAARLSSDAEEVMRLVAIVGRSVNHDVLVASTRLSDEALSAALNEIVACGLLLVDQQREEYTFRHVLTQEAVLNRLLPGERRRLHAAVATAIQAQSETSRSASRAAECATHWYLSGDTSNALTAAITAGRLAAEVYAYAEAWHQFSRALKLDNRVGEQLGIGATSRLNLLTEAAEAARWTGSLDIAVGLASTALNLADVPADQAQITERIGRYHWESGHTSEAQAAFDQAHLLLANAVESPLVATVTASRAHFLLLSGHHQAAIPLAREAVLLASSVGAPSAEGRARITLGLSLIFSGSLGEGAELVRQGHDLVSRWGDLDDRRRADSNLSYALLITGHTADACQAALNGLALIRRYGLEAAAGAGLTANTIVLLRLTGRWSEAQQLSDEVVNDDHLDAKAPQVHLARAELCIVRGVLDQARDALDRAWQFADGQAPRPLVVDLRMAESQLALERRDLIAARNQIEQASRDLPEDSAARMVLQLCRLTLRIEADIAEQARWTRSPELHPATDPASVLLRAQSANVASPSPEGAAIAATAAAEHSRCRLSSDADLWRRASQAWEGIARPHELAYSCFRQAEAELEGRKGSRAGAEPLRRSYQLAVTLGAPLLRKEIEDLARRSRIAVAPQEFRRQQPQHTRDIDLGLTPRELDILRALAQGYSNRDIGKQLFLSHRTVAVHVSNVLRKLGVTTRGQAAAAATRLRLLTTKDATDDNSH